MVAIEGPARLCIATHEEHVWDAASGKVVARADLDVDGGAWLSSSQQREKTIFMKREGDEWIMHGLLVDDMIHAATNDELLDQFIREYKADFDITLEDVMSSFLWIAIGHNKKDPAIHLDTYVQETLTEYKAAVSKFLKPKKVHMQQGVMLEQNDCPETPDLVKQKVYRSFVAKLQFAASWVRGYITFFIVIFLITF